MFSILFTMGCFPEFSIRNFPPTIDAFSPENENIVNFGENVVFSVTITDNDSPLSEAIIRIESDINGPILEGIPDDSGVFRQSFGELEHGIHQMSIYAQDDLGNNVRQSFSLTVNAIPFVEGVLIRPENPTTTDNLEVFITQSSDDDGDLVELEYYWYKNGALQEYPVQQTIVPSSDTQKEDVWAVEVVPTDGNARGIPQGASAVIHNSPPNLDTVTISPEENVFLDTTLSCHAEGEDLDGDSLEEIYIWNIISQGLLYDISFFGQTFTPSAPLVQPGDQITCTALLSTDGGVESDSVQQSVTIANQSPEFNQDVLVYVPTGSGVRVGSTLDCYASVFDPDGSSVTVDYIWTNGSSILKVDPGFEGGSVSSLTLTQGNAKRDDVIRCLTTVYDPHGGQAELESPDSMVVNTPPIIVSVGLSPLSPTTQDILTCVPVSTDIDGDEVTHEFTWSINGNVIQTGPTDTLEGPFSTNDMVSCYARPSDGQDFDALGNVLQASISITNTPPEIQNIILTPEEPTINDLIIADVDVIDIDLDETTLNYVWYVDGEVAKDSLGDGLDGITYFQRNQQVYVAVTPFDGSDYGQTIISDVRTIRNSAPLIDDVEITPETPVPGVNDLLCSIASPPTDSDGDDINIAIQWYVNGTHYTGGTLQTYYLNDTIPAIFTTDGDQWECIVEVSDDTLTNTAVSDPLDVNCLNGYGNIESCPASSCVEILQNRPSTYSQDGLFWLDPLGEGAFQAYCDMTHDGGGWTLLLKTTGSATDLYYDSLYWESLTVLNTESNEPNTNELGQSSKFSAYNDVVGETLRLEFVTPVAWNILHYGLGFCSDEMSKSQSECESSEFCSESDYMFQSDCEDNGLCSDVQYQTDYDCINAGETWFPHQWSNAEWIPGMTALSLFQGDQVMIQGEIEPDGCPGGVLTQNFTDEMQFSDGHQFFGINGYNLTEAGNNLFHETKIRFGYGSNTIDNSSAILKLSWRPQIGIGLHEYNKFGLAGHQYSTYDYSTAWLDPIEENSVCGFYGNGLGAGAQEAASNLWIR